MTGTSLIAWDTLITTQTTSDFVATIFGVLPVIMPIIIAVTAIRVGMSLFRGLVN